MRYLLFNTKARLIHFLLSFIKVIIFPIVIVYIYYKPLPVGKEQRCDISWKIIATPDYRLLQSHFEWERILAVFVEILIFHVNLSLFNCRSKWFLHIENNQDILPGGKQKYLGRKDFFAHRSKKILHGSV